MTALPEGWGIRRPSLDDVPAILEVCQASDIAAVGEPDFTADEVRETLTAPNHDMARDSWLALDAGGTVVGWGYIDNPIRGPRDNVDVYVHPDRGRPSQAYLLDLAIARVAERATEAGLDSVVLRAGAVPTEEFYLGILAEAGFTWIKRYARMRIDLTGTEQAPEPPPGVVIRTARDDEADRRLFWRLIDEAFRDLPDFRQTTFENYQERLAAVSGISWDEWFVAELDGEPVGVLESADHSHDNLEGWVHYLAVNSSVRGRGIGRLLLRTAFATYVAKGYKTAGLGVDLTNPTGAYPLYTAVGMRPAYEIEVLERSVAAA